MEVYKWEFEVPNLNMQKEDQTMWKSTNGNLVEFSSKTAREVLSQQSTMVRWHKVVTHSVILGWLLFYGWL